MTNKTDGIGNKSDDVGDVEEFVSNCCDSPLYIVNDKYGICDMCHTRISYRKKGTTNYNKPVSEVQESPTWEEEFLKEFTSEEDEGLTVMLTDDVGLIMRFIKKVVSEAEKRGYEKGHKEAEAFYKQFID